jgi:hypothetical protein
VDWFDGAADAGTELGACVNERCAASRPVKK